MFAKIKKAERLFYFWNDPLFSGYRMLVCQKVTIILFHQNQKFPQPSATVNLGDVTPDFLEEKCSTPDLV